VLQEWSDKEPTEGKSLRLCRRQHERGAGEYETTKVNERGRKQQRQSVKRYRIIGGKRESRIIGGQRHPYKTFKENLEWTTENCEGNISRGRGKRGEIRKGGPKRMTLLLKGKAETLKESGKNLAGPLELFEHRRSLRNRI